MDPAEDVAQIQDLSQAIHEARLERDAEVQSAKDRVDRAYIYIYIWANLELQHTVAELRKGSTRAAADWRSIEEHMETMTKMENEKFGLAKKINEQETALASLEADLSAFRAKIDAGESRDVEQDVEMDRSAYVPSQVLTPSLALQLFRNMGFVPFHDPAQPNAPITSLLVRSARRNVAVSVDIDEKSRKENKLTSFELAEKLWAAAS